MKTPIPAQRRAPTPKIALITSLAIAVIAAALFASLAVANAARADAPSPAYGEICANGIAVPNPRENQGLLRDCATLLQAKHALAAEPPLNWSANASIYDWEGIKVYELQDIPHANERARVIWLELRERGLNGRIPSELADLERLHRLDFAHNRLTGSIPPELAKLGNLESLNLSGNLLTGRIPPELANSRFLEWIDVSANQLTGQIPAELGALNYSHGGYGMRHLDISANQLTGHIPPELGNLSRLRYLNIGANQLTGQIPTEFSNLANLIELHMSGNQLSGCIPPALNAAVLHDLEQLGLPICGSGKPPAPCMACIHNENGASHRISAHHENQ